MRVRSLATLVVAVAVTVTLAACGATDSTAPNSPAASPSRQLSATTDTANKNLLGLLPGAWRLSDDGGALSAGLTSGVATVSESGVSLTLSTPTVDPNSLWDIATAGLGAIGGGVVVGSSSSQAVYWKLAGSPPPPPPPPEQVFTFRTAPGPRRGFFARPAY